MKLIAEIDGIIAAIKYARQDGRMVAKSIPVDSLCNALSSKVTGASELVIFPQNMRFHGRVGSRAIVGFEEPETVRNITYIGTSGRDQVTNNWKVRMPMSMTIVEFLENDGNKELMFRRLYQFALKAPFFGLETPLFMWPFNNVYDDGACCLGSVHIPNYSDIKETASVLNIFHQGTYNGDMSHERIRTFDPPTGGASIVRPYELWRYLQDDESPKPFPYSVLRPLSTVRALLSNAGFGEIVR